jgi:hypothetical protein
MPVDSASFLLTLTCGQCKLLTHLLQASYSPLQAFYSPLGPPTYKGLKTGLKKFKTAHARANRVLPEIAWLNPKTGTPNPDPASGVDAFGLLTPVRRGRAGPSLAAASPCAGLAPLGQTCGFPRLAAAPPSLAPAARSARPDIADCSAVANTPILLPELAMCSVKTTVFSGH